MTSLAPGELIGHTAKQPQRCVLVLPPPLLHMSAGSRARFDALTPAVRGNTYRNHQWRRRRAPGYDRQYRPCASVAKSVDVHTWHCRATSNALSGSPTLPKYTALRHTEPIRVPPSEFHLGAVVARVSARRLLWGKLSALICQSDYCFCVAQ